MQLADLTVKGFLDKTASNEPVPGGGSISALNGAIASALAEMVANLTIGRKKYVEVEDIMKEHDLAVGHDFEICDTDPKQATPLIQL